jgi:type II secretory pathway component PulK
MERNKQKGMILPLVLVFLSVISLLASKIYGLAEQQRGGIRGTVMRSHANTVLYSIEDLVVRKLPLIDIALFQRLRGEDETDPVIISFSLPEGGRVTASVISAQQCLNIAPLDEGSQENKAFTHQLFSRLVEKLNQPMPLLNASENQGQYHFSEALRPFVCYLPGISQKWDIHYLKIQHLPLLSAAWPETSRQTLAALLQKGITASDLEKMNILTASDILVDKSRYFWLEVKITRTSHPFYTRSLIKIEGRNASIISRHLMEDYSL